MFEDRIDYFILAYESQNFSIAAAHIPMSPQGFSKAIRNLERQLGVTLFALDADGQRRPTPYADRFYEYAQAVQQERRALQHSFDEITGKGAVELQVASSLGVAGLIGKSLRTAFARRCPEVRLTVIEMTDEDCERFVHEERYRCGLLVSPARGDMAFREAYRTNVCLWVHRGNPLFDCERLLLDDLVGQSIAMPGHGYKCYRRLVERMEDAGLALPDIVERSEIMWIYEEVARGRALGFCLPYMERLAAFSHNDAVRAIPVEGSRWGFGIAHTREPAPGSYEAIFEECVVESVRGLDEGYGPSARASG